ncbi:MAG: holo-[acyl-carrier-protein] synthase [Chloroflexi bacterium]|nr:holo-[acyl-carrier-protein] synthase [Chloroflexota bacterium]
MRIGVDLIEIARIEKALNQHGERFLRRVYTAREQAAYAQNPRSLAARWAAKEAAAKALGCGIGAVRWVEIEVLTNAEGAPELTLHGEAARRAQALGLSQWQVSLSHTKALAIAFVIAL